MPPTKLERATYGKVTRRLMPLLFISYTLSYVDRINIGFAKLQMTRDLQMSNVVYGAGAGIFFLSYFLFEIPANLLLVKFGAKLSLGLMMLLWGIVSTSTMFVHSANQFYVARLLLGTVEAGFFPGVILYLTFWYTERYRARIVALFMSAIPLSGVISGAVSGWILARMAEVAGLHAWQWLFLIEGLPPIFLGFLVLVFLPNRPAEAKWLHAEQRELLTGLISNEQEAKVPAGSHAGHFLHAFKSADVWLLCAIFFGFVMASYGIGFWLPQILSETLSKDPMRIGLLSMIPWGTGAVAMIAVGRHSDITGERVWHIALSGLVAAVAFAICALPSLSQALGLIMLSFATAGVMASIATFWSLPAALLSSTAAAAGIAWINSVGSLAGYVSPYLVGNIRDSTKSMTWPLLVLAGSCLFSALVILRLRDRTRSRPEIINVLAV